MIDLQYQEFLSNFTTDLNFVLLKIVDLIQTDDQKENLNFENIVNTMLEDNENFIYSNDDFVFKAKVSLDLNSYSINLTLKKHYSPTLICEIADNLYEINEFSIAKFRFEIKGNVNFLIYYP